MSPGIMVDTHSGDSADIPHPFQGVTRCVVNDTVLPAMSTCGIQVVTNTTCPAPAVKAAANGQRILESMLACKSYNWKRGSDIVVEARHCKQRDLMMNIAASISPPDSGRVTTRLHMCVVNHHVYRFILCCKYSGNRAANVRQHAHLR